MQTGTVSFDDQKTPAPFRSVLAMALLAGTAVLAASFLNLLHYLGYPLLRPETGIVAAGLLGVVLIAASLYVGSGRVGRALMEGLLAFLAVDLNLDFVWVALAVGLAVASIVYLKRVSVLPVMALFAGVILMTSLGGLGERRAPVEKTQGSVQAATAGPAIVHIILDEHVGLAGITDPALRSEMELFYASRGFRLFDRAYSRHYHTLNAVPDILNFGGAGAAIRKNRHLRAGPTAYFGLLGQRGYAINIYQPEFGDYCSDTPFASCTLFSESNLAVMRDLPISTSQKARQIALKFAALSFATVGAVDSYNIVVLMTGLSDHLPVLDVRRSARTSTLSGMAAFDTLTADLRQARRGNVYFAHLLFPHRPFVAGADCAVLPPSSWSLGSIAARGAYHRQLRCALRKLDRALEALAASPGGADAVVIVHGDHGSRLANLAPRADRASRLTGDDLIAGYSTLFAARAPGLESGVDPRPASAPDLLQALARSGFTSAETERRPGRIRTVMLEDRDWVPTLAVPLPDEWQDPPR